VERQVVNREPRFDILNQITNPNAIHEH
jgi:hypothetical protein